MAYGARVSLIAGLGAAVVSVAIGLVIGVIAGWFRSLDGLIMRTMDAIMAIPGILLAIALVSVSGASLTTVLVAITIPEIPRVVRLVRGQILTVRGEPYVEAALALGTPLPAAVAPHGAQHHRAADRAGHLCVRLGHADRGHPQLLGAGVPPEIASWGNIMSEGRMYFRMLPGLILFPGLFLSLTVLSVNILATPCATRWTRKWCAGPDADDLLPTPRGRHLVRHPGHPQPVGRSRRRRQPRRAQPEPGRARRRDRLRGWRIRLGQVGHLAGRHGLLPQGILKIGAGSIRVEGEDVATATPRRLRELRATRMAMVFQEPMTALNPVHTVGKQVDEVLRLHRKMSAAERRAKVLEMFRSVHLPDVERIYDAYPHQLSGGQRQRIVIAMALILEPRLLIADEPTTALDVTTQKQILALIKELQVKHKTAVLFITHDFGVVAEISDRIIVMNRGDLVESGTRHEILAEPKQSYTRRLVSSVPSLVPSRREAPAGQPVLHVRVWAAPTAAAARCSRASRRTAWWPRPTST